MLGGMPDALATLLGIALKSTAVMLVINEVRGLILAAPVLYGIYHAGGSLMAIWIGFCSLAGIALSVVVPVYASKKLQRVLNNRQVRAKLPEHSLQKS